MSVIIPQVNTNADGCQCSEVQIFQAIAQILALLGNTALNSRVTGLNVRDTTGLSGAVVETGTTLVNGDFVAIEVLDTAVFASYTAPDLTGDTLVGVSLATGTVIRARFSAFTLTSGKVIAYKSAT